MCIPGSPPFPDRLTAARWRRTGGGSLPASAKFRGLDARRKLNIIILIKNNITDLSEISADVSQIFRSLQWKGILNP